MPVTWMELNHTTQPQTHFISINMRHLGTKIRDEHFPAFSFTFRMQQTVKIFGSFFLWSRTKFKFEGKFQVLPSSEHFPTAADRNELEVVWIWAEVSGYSECWYLWLHLPRSGRHLAPPPTQTVSAGPELIPTYNWNQNERKNPQKVATAPAASSRQSRLIFWSSYAAGAERCTRGGPQSDIWSPVWSWDG